MLFCFPNCNIRLILVVAVPHLTLEFYLLTGNSDADCDGDLEELVNN